MSARMYVFQLMSIQMKYESVLKKSYCCFPKVCVLRLVLMKNDNMTHIASWRV